MKVQILKVNLEVYSSVLVKFGRTTKRPYLISVEVPRNLKIKLVPSSVPNSLSVTLGAKASPLTLSTMQYDSIRINVGNISGRNTRLSTFVLSLPTLATPVVILLHQGVAGLPLKRRDYQQDPIVMNKGSKYRHRLKAFWSKRSDRPRGQYSRHQRLKTLTDLHVDAKVRRAFALKQTSAKFLAWKLSSNPNDIQAQTQQRRLNRGSIKPDVAAWLSTHLVQVLIFAGFYTSATQVCQEVSRGHILVNGLVVTKANYLVKSGDLITVMSPPGMTYHTVPGLYINTGQASVLVVSATDVAAWVEQQVSRGILVARSPKGPMLDPTTHLLHYTSNQLNRGIRR